MRVTTILASGLLLAIGGCYDREPIATVVAPEAHVDFGTVMAQVARRFERAGRAMTAQRYDLAAYDIEELNELFTDDLPHAEPPKENSAALLLPIAAAFAQTHPGRLKAAAKAHDLAAYRDAFKEASAACNACHLASGHPFIQVPSTLEKPVPNLDFLPPDAGTP